MYITAHLTTETSVCVCVCVVGCGCVCVCVCVRYVCVLNLHVKAFLKALVYMILWFNFNVIDVVNVVMFYLVIISDTTKKFLPGDKRFIELIELVRQ